MNGAPVRRAPSGWLCRRSRERLFFFKGDDLLSSKNRTAGDYSTPSGSGIFIPTDPGVTRETRSTPGYHISRLQREDANNLALQWTALLTRRCLRSQQRAVDTN
jgi:hypothetical protein